MDEEHFAQEFLILQTCKQIFPSELTSLVYWEELKDLDYLSETLKECRDRQWFKDFNARIPRFPETIEIKEVNKEITKKMKSIQEKVVKVPKQVPNKYFGGKPKGYGRVLSNFCTDLMSAKGISCSEAWDFIEKNNIEVPMKYKTSEIVELAERLLGENLKKLRRVKANGNLDILLRMKKDNENDKGKVKVKVKVNSN